MLWKGKRESDNVEDRRGLGGKQLVAGGGIIGIVILLLNVFLGGGDANQIQQQLNNATQTTSQSHRAFAIGSSVGSLKDVVVLRPLR